MSVLDIIKQERIETNQIFYYYNTLPSMDIFNRNEPTAHSLTIKQEEIILKEYQDLEEYIINDIREYFNENDYRFIKNELFVNKSMNDDYITELTINNLSNFLHTQHYDVKYKILYNCDILIDLQFITFAGQIDIEKSHYLKEGEIILIPIEDDQFKLYLNNGRYGLCKNPKNNFFMLKIRDIIKERKQKLKKI
jgi:hypothetical protein